MRVHPVLRVVATLATVLTLQVVPVSAGAPSVASQDIVVRLYRDRSPEVVLEGPIQPVLWYEPPRVWEKYFSKRIVQLYARAWECGTKWGICTIEASPIWYSQDPGGVTVDIQSGPSEVTVFAVIRYPVDAIGAGTAKLEYRMIKQGREWKIDDISYPDGSSLTEWLTDALK